MKKLNPITCSIIALVAGVVNLLGQALDVPGGSGNPSGDPLIVLANDLKVLEAREDGVYDYPSITIEPGATLKFERNDKNTPICLFSSGPIIIQGMIDVSGTTGTELVGGKGGHGGFDGGGPGPAGLPGGRGHGPGGGGPGTTGDTAESAGAGAYAHPPGTGSSGKGVPYGGPLLIPLIGGSGGGGVNNGAGGGGGGGGGAILVCSDTLIDLTGKILANGGNPSLFARNMGSGGAIRLVAPKIKGTGEVRAHGELTSGAGIYGSGGRIRIDTHDRSEMACALNGGSVSQGSFVVARLPAEPKLHVVDVAGTAIPVGSIPPPIVLPLSAAADQLIEVRADNFGTSIDLQVALIPVNGIATVHPLTIDNAAANPAFGTLNVTIPGNTLLHVEVYKR